MEIKKRRLLLKTIACNPLEEKLRERKEAARVRAPLKRSYMRRPEDVKHPEKN